MALSPAGLGVGPPGLWPFQGEGGLQLDTAAKRTIECRFAGSCLKGSLKNNLTKSSCTNIFISFHVMPRFKALGGPVYKAWETSLCDSSRENQKRLTLKAKCTVRGFLSLSAPNGYLTKKAHQIQNTFSEEGHTRPGI